MTAGERIILAMLRATERARAATYHFAPTEDRFVAWGRATAVLAAFERTATEQDARDGEPEM